MPSPSELDANAGVLAYWGSELCKYREKAQWSQKELAHRISYSTSLVGLVETAKRAPTREFAAKCDEVLETGGALVRLWPLIGRDVYPVWFRPFVELEREARPLRSFQPVLVPGLLQTEDYARAVLRAGRPGDTDEQVEELVAARMERQRILTKPDPPMFWAILDEAVLIRPVGGPQVMRKQLEQLLELVRRPRITIQVIPLDVGAHAGLTGAFVIASFRGSPDIVYLETAAEGQIVNGPTEIETLLTQLDALRACALPQSASVALMEKAMGSWT
ncbi:helix-turn-helix domain-containing protein [Streptosporangium vulgare]|uniref:Helix-turn-helix transcriptional regulator n=1 Tax=Streptosporangium vulgare TaxID=46190 RepID=A0ABV5TM20_9ACTN